MSCHKWNSNLHAKKLMIFGHISTGMGERAHTQKLRRLLPECEVVDVIEELGDRYEPLATLNMQLARDGFDLVEDAHSLSCSADLYMVLSWSYSVAALHACGLFRKGPVITKLYAHHEQEQLPLGLYEKSQLLVTESPLACKKALEAGITPNRLLYMPHNYPLECETIVPSRQWKGVCIGIVSRLVYGKNCEFALEAVRQLVEEGFEITLVLKGDFEEEERTPEFRTKMEEMLRCYSKASWFVWEREPSPLQEALALYASFDICLQLSGAEGASNVVVEQMALGKPVVVLDTSTNPSLFSGGALFVKTKGAMRHAQVPFHTPDLEQTQEVLRSLVQDATMRKKWGQKANAHAKRCFHPDLTCQRVEHLFNLQGSQQLMEEDFARHNL